MSFFAILFALLLEQARPLARGNPVHAGVRRWTQWSRHNFDAGKPHHGWVVWGVTVGVPSLVALAVYLLLDQLLGWPFAMLWNVVVLYVTLGFRQFSHHFTDIRDALDAGDEALARERLAEWQQVDASALPRSEIVRHVIEYSVLAAHRHVFGVLTWYSLLAVLGMGPAGAVLYRLSEFVSRAWRQPLGEQLNLSASEALQSSSSRAWAVVDWLPARATALGFAIVGSFEEAIDSWRHYAQRFPNDNDGVILAATSGAINVRLGGEALRAARPVPAEEGLEPPQAPSPEMDSESLPGRKPETAHLAQVVGLVWRTVVMWLLLLAVLTLARLLG